MQIKNIVDKNILDDFVSTQGRSQFLQSWEWGEFQEKAGNKIFRIGVEESGELVVAATLIKKSLFFGKSYFYCPRGPLISIKNYELRITNYFFDEIKKIAEQENIIFLRFEPSFEIQNSKLEILRSIDIQPSKTLILDLTKSEEELLAAMHQKTRYNIRLAEKKGVKIIEAGTEKFDDFWRLMEVTCARDKYRLHSCGYYAKMLSKKNLIKLYLAEYKNKPIAAVLASFSGDTVTYLHGASDNEERNVMAPFLLQWEIIKIAKQAGYKYYDFYGIDENKWPGVTRFKKGFGGEEMEYPGTYDLIFNYIWYKVYNWLRKIRRMV
jgi:peptidoglycan pentaglycine glycine transferase (the first glycine)